MQATTPWLAVNRAHIEPAQAPSAVTGAPVNGVKLRQSAVRLYQEIPPTQRNSLEADAEALLGADLEIPEASQNASSIPCAVEPEIPPNFRSFKPESANPTRLEVLRELCDWIQTDPFQARYRRVPHGTIVLGWDQRLNSYFWPSPEVGLQRTIKTLEPILAKAEKLATVLDHGGLWTAQQADDAVQLAVDIFDWGGVPQLKPAAAAVEAVLRSAITGQMAPGAPMNSGWTKVAAFGSAWLEGLPDRTPQAIWDSRVASSLLRRLDHILHASAVNDPRALFGAMGRVLGRNGRPGRLRLPWPNGYGSWASQFAGTAAIRDIRHILNGGSFPLPRIAPGRWTIRYVEMVLFMDGY